MALFVGLDLVDFFVDEFKGNLFFDQILLSDQNWSRTFSEVSEKNEGELVEYFQWLYQFLVFCNWCRDSF